MPLLSIRLCSGGYRSDGYVHLNHGLPSNDSSIVFAGSRCVRASTTWIEKSRYRAALHSFDDRLADATVFMAVISFSTFSAYIGVVSGLIALLSTVFAVYFCRFHLPSTRIKHLEDLLKDTESIYNSGVESNLLPSHSFRRDAQARLISLQYEMYRHRQRAHRAFSLRQQWAEFFKGLSSEINRTCDKVKVLRADVNDACEAERFHLSDARMVGSYPGVHGGSHMIGNGLQFTVNSVKDIASTALPPVSCSQDSADEESPSDTSITLKSDLSHDKHDLTHPSSFGNETALSTAIARGMRSAGLRSTGLRSRAATHGPSFVALDIADSWPASAADDVSVSSSRRVLDDTVRVAFMKEIFYSSRADRCSPQDLAVLAAMLRISRKSVRDLISVKRCMMEPESHLHGERLVTSRSAIKS
ncbi:hypothetical protein PLICRDRAFT_58489 [Plicaturopsis crispa FD-325 SS-3]|uniref:Uncharacterized protein n=1 Tax=Plicaturopsis crispa FD-325 SS-3 TaxID=944288 RepID=A0A0C9T243_PLICR|nr:hypothetical protein PLICRDRAFT_58489 [Plicaturopsis crispa FD-325 SS-3]